jgi:NADPH2:quinone reductase
MKAVLCKAFCEPEGLAVGEAAPPALEPGTIRIAVHAAGVNFADTLMIAGKYQVKPPFPFSPGMELAGEVIEAGAGATRLGLGTRVMATAQSGAFAEEAVVPEAAAVAIPDAMDYITAASFPIAYGTSYHALLDRARLQSGEVLLVHGAAGGVGRSAVEIGRALGARVIGTVGSDGKAAVARAAGATDVINYSTQSIRDRVKDLTDGRGADVIYDPVGGDAFDQSMRCIAWAGRLLVIGFASGRIPEVAANRVLLKGCSVVGVFWGSFFAKETARSQENFTALLEMVADGRLKPLVFATYPLGETPAALRALLSRKSTGKVVVAVR